MGVLELGGDADFAEEAVAAECRGEVGRRTLIATRLPWRMSSAIQTVAMPPCPSRRSSR